MMKNTISSYNEETFNIYLLKQANSTAAYCYISNVKLEFHEAGDSICTVKPDYKCILCFLIKHTKTSQHISCLKIGIRVKHGPFELS